MLKNISYKEKQLSKTIFIVNISISIGLILLICFNPVVIGLTKYLVISLLIALIFSNILVFFKRLTIATHITITGCMLVIWALCATTLGKDNIISVIDTVVYIYPLIIFSALIADKKSSLIYTIMNIIFLSIYMYYLYYQNIFNKDICIEFFCDIAVALIFIGICSWTILKKSEENLLTIQDYANNLEKKVEERTEELQTANEEMEAINSQLIETKDQLWGEMQLAKKIQTVLLPHNPAIQGFEISAYMVPANEVGGDYYDIINVANKDWIVIGDVSGHGVPAGLVMMMVQTAIHVTIEQNPNLNPSELLTIINKTIYNNIKNLNDDKYMTITVLAYHNQEKFYFSGLHQDILIYRKKNNIIDIIETNGMWIGIIDNINGMVTDDHFYIEKDDIILLYTDGIIESTKNDKMYSSQLKYILHENSNCTCEEIKRKILDSLQGYNIFDDITFMILRKL